jgi:hypothetical protein
MPSGSINGLWDKKYLGIRLVCHQSAHLVVLG